MSKGKAGGMRLGCDIGGTFTDFVWIDDSTGEIKLEKVPTTPAAPEKGVLNGIDVYREASPGFARDLDVLVHGTTLVINALIERKGSPTALITTAGFRDILEMRNEIRYDIYDLQLEFPQPLVPRYLRFEIDERISASGKVLEPIDVAPLAQMLPTLRENGISTVAVVLLHSYANPAHERQIERWFARNAPEIAISLSSEILPRIREYGRTSTTVATAYVKPKVRDYLDRLQTALGDLSFSGDFFMMQSSAGVIKAELAKEHPARVIESGPAAGVAAAAWWAKYCGFSDILAFDMGGTTAKLCAVMGGVAPTTDEYEVARIHHSKKGSGLQVNVPVLDLLEIGTGGGSIAHVDRLKLLKVGPRSSGAVPGPACYGRGGTNFTVTDADLLLGYLGADCFLGGSMRLNAEAAREAASQLDLGMTPIQLACGVHDIANEDMVVAARLHLAERGLAGESLALVAFGGAGPVHAWGIARNLGLSTVIVPPAAGVMSALGMLIANIAIDRERAHGRLLADSSLDAVGKALIELEDEATALLPKIEGGELSFSRTGTFRYAGQGFSISVQLPLR